MATSKDTLHRLTTVQVQTAREGDHGDGGGLLLRVKGPGASWVFRYTAPSGRRREMGLGAVQRDNPKMAGESLRTARRLAHDARELLRLHTDPIDDREQRREAERQADEQRRQAQARQERTLARCARDYHARVIEPTRTDKHGAQWLASLENHMPASLWHAPIDSITAPMVLKALQGIKPHERARRHDGDSLPETVRRIRQRLDAIFEDAIFHGHATANPAAAVRRKLQEAIPTKTAGQFAALPYTEAPAFMARLRTMPGTAARTLELAMLCAARTGEVLGARWCEIDLDAATWLVPAARMKGGEPHLVPLSARAVDVLRGQVGQHPELVFPSAMKADSEQSNMAMLVLLGRMGERHRTTVHGLCRATFSTWANETGAARPDAIEAALAHSEGDRIRAAYNRADFHAERRALLQAWADYLSRPALALVAA